MVFHLQSQRLVLYGWEKILYGECCLLVLDLILLIICGHVLFSFRLFCFFLKKIQKHWKFSKRQIFYFVSCFIFLEDYMNYDVSLSWFRICLILWRNLNSMCYISTKLFLILYEYVLVCTCTHRLIKKLIFLVCVLSIA